MVKNRTQVQLETATHKEIKVFAAVNSLTISQAIQYLLESHAEYQVFKQTYKGIRSEADSKLHTTQEAIQEGVVEDPNQLKIEV